MGYVTQLGYTQLSICCAVPLVAPGSFGDKLLVVANLMA